MVNFAEYSSLIWFTNRQLLLSIFECFWMTVYIYSLVLYIGFILCKLTVSLHWTVIAWAHWAVFVSILWSNDWPLKSLPRRPRTSRGEDCLQNSGGCSGKFGHLLNQLLFPLMLTQLNVWKMFTSCPLYWILLLKLCC